ncbi:hypothetical protein AGOR_G00208920 [Albula goreensis]|uniref:Pre-B-cell leukemia transcription factor-interacting protein 1 n=1 Tax=Albula goreensis TaxID=1534307 RepID=A0A8T3CLE6_9TELE|nr:hypothetical protein AGOR_G00208920 [Albula goreensis]
MSESGNITNSNGSGSSWTVLTPEESVGSVGPGVGGNESLAASHGLAEEGTGEVTEMERGDLTAQTEEAHSDRGLQEPAVENIGTEAEGNEGFTDTPDLPGVTESAADPAAGGRRAVQTDGARSEEGLQVCQETGSSQGSAPPSPTILSPSPPSNISLSYNFQGYTQSSNEPDVFSDTYTHISSSPESHVAVGPCPESVVSFPTPPSQGRDGLEHEEEESELSNKITEVGKQAESPYDSELGVGSGTEGEGLRKRKTLSLGPLDQVERDGDEEVEEEQRRPRDGEDGGGITLNKCILGALILLGLGTILFSGAFTDLDYEDVDVRELSDTELHGNKEQLNSDTEPQGGQEMAELLDKLAKENQQINELQSRLQSQEEELSLALQQAEEKGREIARNGELEKENERMKEELASLPALQSELESLRARVMELTLLTAKEESQQGPASPSAAPSSGHTENSKESPAVEEATGATEESDPLREELERQKVLLDGSRKRLEGMKNDKEHRNKWEGNDEPKEMAKKERHWRGTPDKTPLKPSHRHHEHNDYWKRKKEKLQHFYRPLVACIGIAECAKMEGLTPVRLADFEALLGGYLSKIEGAEAGGKEEISKLVKEFFVDGVFTHDKISFRDFVEDVADILEDMVEGDGEDDDAAEDEMEEFEKDALRKFSVTGGEEKVDTNVKK